MCAASPINNLDQRGVTRLSGAACDIGAFEREQPAVSLSPTSLNFDSQLVGTTSAAQPVTLSNSGNALLTINDISTSGDYAQTNDCASSLAAGASCTINVTFTPTASGSRSGMLTISR